MATQAGIPSEGASKQLGLDVVIEDQVNEKRHQILAAIEQIKQQHKMKKDNLGSKFNGAFFNVDCTVGCCRGRQPATRG